MLKFYRLKIAGAYLIADLRNLRLEIEKNNLIIGSLHQLQFLPKY